MMMMMNKMAIVGAKFNELENGFLILLCDAL